MRNAIILTLLGIFLLTACDKQQRAAEEMLQQAEQQFADRQYDLALSTLDSLRRTCPKAVEARKQALRLKQDISLKQAEEELAVVDSTLLAANQQFEALKHQVEEAKQSLSATPEELTKLTLTRMYRDSLQTRFDLLCSKIRYIRKKQKEL